MNHENEVLQQAPDRTIVQMADGRGGGKAAYAATLRFTFISSSEIIQKNK